MSNSSNSGAQGVGIFTVVFVVFLILKLAGVGEVASWSWWWVTCPLWMPLLLAGFLLALTGAMLSIRWVWRSFIWWWNARSFLRRMEKEGDDG